MNLKRNAAALFLFLIASSCKPICDSIEHTLIPQEEKTRQLLVLLQAGTPTDRSKQTRLLSELADSAGFYREAGKRTLDAQLQMTTVTLSPPRYLGTAFEGTLERLKEQEWGVSKDGPGRCVQYSLQHFSHWNFWYGTTTWDEVYCTRELVPEHKADYFQTADISALFFEFARQVSTATSGADFQIEKVTKLFDQVVGATDYARMKACYGNYP